MLAVALDGIVTGPRCATGEAQRGVAERSAELEDALGVDRGRERTEQRTVRIGIGAAAMACSMRHRRCPYLCEWIDRLLFGHEMPRIPKMTPQPQEGQHDPSCQRRRSRHRFVVWRVGQP